MFRIKSKKVRFLIGLRKEIDNLPWKIWEYKDEDNPNYDAKRKELVGRVMHIENKIWSYILNYHKCLADDFKRCAFFPIGMRFDPFNEENNTAWKKGKMDYLRFIDKLLDFAEAERIYESIDVKKLLIKSLWFTAVFLILCCIIFLDKIVNIEDYGIDYKFRFQLVFFAAVSLLNIIWYKNWRDFFPVTTAIGGALLGLHL